MAYDEQSAQRIRQILFDKKVFFAEKKMFSGVCFMVDDKMCVGVVKDEMMCRINPEMDVVVLEMNGCRAMDFTGKRMKGYVYISDEGMETKKNFEYWINLCLEFNVLAKASKKKVKKKPE